MLWLAIPRRHDPRPGVITPGGSASRAPGQPDSEISPAQRASEFHDGVHYAIDEVRAITGHV
jgi:hypothetical protein